MQTGTISFCDRHALNIKSEDVKRRILTQLGDQFGQHVVRRHYDMYNPEITPQRLQTKPHLMCLKSNGNPYFMMLTRVNHVNTCVFIDKKIRHGYFLPRMIIAHLQFHDSLFDGTVMEGEMVHAENGSWYFLINDLLAHKGARLLDVMLPERIELLYNALHKEYKELENPLFQFRVKRYVPCHRVRELVEELSEKLPYTNRGLMLKPYTMRARDILVNFEQGLKKTLARVRYGDENRFIAPNELVRTFKIRNTSEPDVYELLEQSTGNVVGQPLVNTLETSRKLNVMFEHARVVDTFEIKCRFDNIFKKWTPLFR